MRQKVAPHGRIYASHKKLRPTTNITNSKKTTTKDNNNTSKRNDRVNAIRAKWLQQVCKLVYMYHVHTFLTSATIATTMHVHNIAAIVGRRTDEQRIVAPVSLCRAFIYITFCCCFLFVSFLVVCLQFRFFVTVSVSLHT